MDKLIARRVTPSSNPDIFQVFGVEKNLTRPAVFVVNRIEGSDSKSKYDKIETIIENLNTEHVYNDSEGLSNAYV
jgi:hypothetical protein